MTERYGFSKDQLMNPAEMHKRLQDMNSSDEFKKKRVQTSRSTSEYADPLGVSTLAMSKVLMEQPRFRAGTDMMEITSRSLQNTFAEVINEMGGPQAAGMAMGGEAQLIPVDVVGWANIRNEVFGPPTTDQDPAAGGGGGSGQFSATGAIADAKQLLEKYDGKSLHLEQKFKDMLLNGSVAPNVIWAMSILCQHIQIRVTSLKRNRGGKSYHEVGQAVDIGALRFNDGSPWCQIQGVRHPIPEVTKVYQIIDSAFPAGMRRPREVIGPHLWNPNNASVGRTKKGYPIITDAKKTQWMTNADHQDHVHIGYAVPGDSTTAVGGDAWSQAAQNSAIEDIPDIPYN